jgi:hypothetical protein
MEEASMYDYTLSTLSEHIDTNFVIASWLPAFVAVLANLGFVTLLVGPDALAEWAYNLTEVEQFIVLVIVLVVITMLALLLRALSFIIIAFFIGEALPRGIAEWATRRQQRVRVRAHTMQDASAVGATASPLRQQVRLLVEQRFPRDEAAVRPTRLGNVLATAVEYPWVNYAMDGLLWLPHLTPFLPTSVDEALDSAQSRLLGLLKLSLVCAIIAVEAVLVLGVVAHSWAAAVGGAIVAGLLAWFCYQAAVNQALEVASHIRVAFNLYRQEILKQLGLAIPADVVAEQALWRTLTKELLGQSPEAASSGTKTAAAASANG